jgi:beta-N-acetylhexosaminidase
MRVLTAKVHIGITRKRLVDVTKVSDVLDVPEEEERVQQIADHALTLVRNDHGLVPLATPNQACLVIVNGIRISQFGQRMIAELRERAPSARTIIVDPSMREAALWAMVGDTSSCSPLVLAVFGTGGRLAGDLPAFLDKLTSGPAPAVMVGMGSPYVIAAFPKALASLATFNTTLPSEISSVRALFGEIPITGHLPVTLPGIAKYGDGIQLPAKTN